MTTSEFPRTTTETLADLMAAAPVNAPEALRQTLQLAQSLRGLHDSGRIHGAVCPSNISAAGPNWTLLPLDAAGPSGGYTAPEMLEGRPADERSDIFGLGSILYELLAHRPAFEANAPIGPEPPSCGSAAVDRLLANCLAKDPSARYQRMQKLILELKVLTVGVNRANSPAPIRPQQVDHELRSEMRQMEERIAMRLEVHERAMRELESATTEALTGIRSRLAEAATQLAAEQSRGVGLEQSLTSFVDRLGDRFDKALDTVNGRISQMEAGFNSSADRINRLERGFGALDRDSATLRDSITPEMSNFRKVIQAQAAAVESARTALAQTDDLVERVVEALESLQSIVLEHAGEAGKRT
jgi:hypothetical protein